MSNIDLNSGTSEANETVLSLQRIYVKDISFESPNTPHIFGTKWEPELKINLGTNVAKLDNDFYEVVLTISVSTSLKDDEKDEAVVAFVCEVQQAGIFLVRGLNEEELSQILLAECPSILFPYVRGLISNLVAQGSFPQLNLDPINFDVLYEDHLQKQQQEIDKAEKETH